MVKIKSGYTPKYFNLLLSFAVLRTINFYYFIPDLDCGQAKNILGFKEKTNVWKLTRA